MNTTYHRFTIFVSLLLLLAVAFTAVPSASAQARTSAEMPSVAEIGPLGVSVRPLAWERTVVWTKTYKIVCGPGSCTIYYSRGKTAAMYHAWKTGSDIATQALRDACENDRFKKAGIDGACKGAIRVIMAHMGTALADAVRQRACVATKTPSSVFAGVFVGPSRAYATNGKHCFGKAPSVTLTQIPSRTGGCAYHWTRYLKLVPNHWMRGADVTALQKRLKASGAELSIDGVFGPQTDKALRHFQKTHDLEPDGVAGPLTWAKLNKVCP